SGLVAAWLVASTAEILLRLSALPVGAEESADPEERNPGDRHRDAGPEHRPVEPPGGAVVGQVDEEPHHAERDPDPQHRIEDPLAAYVPPSFLERVAHHQRVPGASPRLRMVDRRD